MQMLKRMLIQGVRREMITHKRLRAHRQECPVGRLVISKPDGSFIYPWDGRRTDKKDSEIKTEGSFVSLSWKDGLKVKGAVTWIFGIVVAVGGTIFGLMYIQDISTRKAVNEIMDKKLHAIQIENRVTKEAQK
jgi:WD40 repeat protein